MKNSPFNRVYVNSVKVNGVKVNDVKENEVNANVVKVNAVFAFRKNSRNIRKKNLNLLR